MKKLGELVRSFRQRKRLTLQEFGDLCGFTASMISDIENDRRAPMKKATLESLAGAMGISYKEVYNSASYSKLLLDIKDRERDANDDEEIAVLRLARGMVDHPNLFKGEKVKKIGEILNTF